MRTRESSKIIIKKCKCGKPADMFVDIVGQWHVGCQNCKNYVVELGLKKAVEK